MRARPGQAGMNLFRGWVADDFEREAVEFCELARFTYGLELDYSPGTLPQLDTLIDAKFGPASADENPALIVAMGCYVGEVIIRTHGGQWRADEEIFHSPAVVIAGKLEARTFPLSRVWKRFEFGGQQSLEAYYAEVLRTLARI